MKKVSKNNRTSIEVGDLVMYHSSLHHNVKRYGVVWKVKNLPDRKIKYLYVIWGLDNRSRRNPSRDRYLESWLSLVQACER